MADARARHRERHRPSGYGFVLADRIDYLRRAHWDRLAAGGSLFMSHRYLRALEEAPPENLRQRYALVYDGNEPLAAVATQIVKISAANVVDAKKPLSKLRARLLVCGNLLSWGNHGVRFAGGAEPAVVWPAVAEALYRIRRAERLSGQTGFVMVKDLSEADAGGIDALERFSYRALETEPDMCLDFPESCRVFDDYLATLSAKYRKKARKVLKDVEAAGCVTENLDALTPVAGRLHDLYLQVHERASVRLVTVAPEYLSTLARRLGDDFQCTVVRRGEDLVGFVTTLRDGDTAVGYYIGFDGQVNAECPVYFRLLYAVVEAALRLGCRRVSLGRTALEPKANLGARPVPLRSWIRHRVPPLNLVVRSLLQSIPHDEAPERHAFK